MSHGKTKKYNTNNPSVTEKPNPQPTTEISPVAPEQVAEGAKEAPKRIAPQHRNRIRIMLSPKRLVGPGGYILDLVTEPGKMPGDVRVIRNGDIWTVDPKHPTIIRLLANELLVVVKE